MTGNSYLQLYKRDSNLMPNVEYLIEGILPRKGLVIVLGPSGVGKTQFAMRIAACVAMGHALGIGNTQFKEAPPNFCKPTMTGYTAYVAGEGKSCIVARLKSTEIALPETERSILDSEFEGLLPILPIFMQQQFTGTDQIQALNAEMLSGIDCYPILGLSLRLIVFDTLSAVFAIKDENSNSEMQRVANQLNAYAEYFDCCVVVLAHPPKSKDGPKGYTRGASALIGAADVVLELRKVNQSGQGSMTITKMRDGPYEGTTIKLETKDFGGTAAMVPLYKATSELRELNNVVILTERQEQILNILKQAPTGVRPQKAIFREILNRRNAVENKESPINQKSEQRMINRDIKKLGELGFVSTEKVSKEVIVRLTVENSAPDLVYEESIDKKAKELFKDVRIVPPPRSENL